MGKKRELFDGWQTPQSLANLAASVLDQYWSLAHDVEVKRLETSGFYKPIVGDIGAGLGSLTGAVSRIGYTVTSFEKDTVLRETLEATYKHVWGDFYDYSVVGDKFDCFITNPPFSEGCALIEHAFNLLRSPNTGFVVAILPTAYFQSDNRGKWLIANGELKHEVRLINRVAYIRDGVAHKNRRCYDSIMVLAPKGSELPTKQTVFTPVPKQIASVVQKEIFESVV